jgi:hypothetical protein
MSPSHELTPPLPFSPTAAPPNQSEAIKLTPEAAEAKPKSNCMQKRSDASRRGHSDAASRTKPQPAQVQDSDLHGSDNSTNDDVHSNDDSTDNGERSMHDDSLSSDTSNCNLVFDPGSNRLNDKHRGTATREDGDSTSDDNDTRLCDDSDAASDLTSSGTLGGLVWDCDDDTCGGCSSLPSVRTTHGFDNSSS